MAPLLPPMVTCLLAVRRSPSRVEQAIYYFLRQEYPHRELLVLVAAGWAGAIEPRDDQVRLVEVPPGADVCNDSTIWKVGAELARGDLLAWWSADDWMSPRRLTAQVHILDDTGCSRMQGRSVLTYGLYRGDATAEEGRSVPATALVRRDSVALTGTPGDDTAFVEDPDWYVRVDYGRPSENATARRPFDSVLSRLGDDMSFYIGMRAQATSRSVAQSTRTRERSLTVAVPLYVYDGLGSMGEYLALSLARAGLGINLQPTFLDRAGLTEDTCRLLDGSRPNPTDPAICLAWVGQSLALFRRCEALFVNASWESTELPSGFADRLNAASAVIGPSTWVAEMFRASGVHVPVEVVPQGVDPARYHYVDRPERRGLVTLIVAAWAVRKNIPESISAWQAAFAGDADARLVIKSRFESHAYAPSDPRILFVDTNEKTAGIAHWYRQADVLMALGGEGFGLPLVEGMACGLPVVALDAQGQADVCGSARECVLPVPAERWVPYDDGSYRAGLRAVPDVGAVTDALLWVANNREDARAMGRRASEWALRHRNVWEMGPHVSDVIHRHLGRAGPLRHAGLVAYPDQEGPARRFADRLRSVLPTAMYRSGLGELNGSRFVNVHYDDGFDDGDLDRFVQRARGTGVVVAVTAHTLPARPAAWERSTDVFAVSDDAIADSLNRRWPTRQVMRLSDDVASAYSTLWASLSNA